MKQLSRPLDAISSHYDAIVVGSGYGGGVAVSRLARCGKRVCLLERGREILPGEFPDRMGEGMAQFRIRGKGGDFGSRLGLFDLHVGDDIHVLVGNGLGGTSLINANVALQAESGVMADKCWPAGIVADPDLATGYARARAMLRPAPVPQAIADKLPKVDALKAAAKALDAPFYLPPINVVFEAGPNSANVVQPACNLCGDCCSGCNAGSKTTVQMTYIPDAVNHGAEVFTEAEVRFLQREGGKWRVFYEPAGDGDDAHHAPEQSVTADIVVLAAGTLGSTEILLRSREHGLSVSQRLGESFTGNGDVLAFAYNNDRVINGIGVGVPPKAEAHPPEIGPCIGGIIDLRKGENLSKDMVIEDGSIPGALSPVLPSLMVGGGALAEDADFGFADEISETARATESLLFGAYSGAVRNTQTFLVMSHDDGGGKIVLDNDATTVLWPGVASQANFRHIEEMLERATAATGGTYLKNPITQRYLGHNLITVHPLGGCAMGESAATGVVNHKCQVFDAAAEGGSVHEGLYVCDGSVMPRPLGVNPLLTITAVAERSMIKLAQDRGWSFDDKPKPDAPLRQAAPEPEGTGGPPAGVEFTERMAGYWSSTVTDDFEAAERDGKLQNNALSFILTVTIDDIASFVAEKDHAAGIAGTVTCPSLSSRPLDISNGRFNLFVVDEESVELRRMDYTMELTSREGKRYRFIGKKHIHNEPGLDLWSDTTRLFFDIYDAANSSHVGRGVLGIAIGDFLTQMRTMHGRGGDGPLARARAVLKFGELFGENLFSAYGGVFAPLSRYDPDRMRKKRELRTGDPEVYWFDTPDGFRLRLARYKGGDKGPVLLSHGLGVSSLIFSIDTINTNLVEFLYAAGYDCWLLDYRASIELPYAERLFSADDVALQDYPAAVKEVLRLTGAESLQAIVHCYGATTFFMAMLKGLEGVRAAVVSQIAVDVFVPWWPQRLLAHLRLPNLMALFGIKAVDARASTKDRWWLKALDRVIRIVLPTEGEERNQSATSNRITALYGPLYEHAQLNQSTHIDGLPEMFGKANIKAFKQLAAIARKTFIVDAGGEDVYREREEKLKLPICFIHGAENHCFLPKSTQTTYDRLVRKYGADLYKRHVIPGYGHIDSIFGKNAARDVYPHILQHLERNL
ncbi:alpha/beta fold hydrolase [Sinorhizobium meliloti]|uniref:alpha/beta fold hydrolase n=1 Tax=Rhizobium meliloti TaxID=382 RepID=UPI003D652117